MPVRSHLLCSIVGLQITHAHPPQAFEWRIFDQNEHVDILGVDILPLPVHHGKIFSTPGAPYYCLGFLFDRKIAYLSDVSLVPEEVWDLLERVCTLPEEWRPKKEGEVEKVENVVNGWKVEEKPVIQALVVDCLRIETFTSHFGLGEAVGTARRMGALKTYLVSKLASHPIYTAKLLFDRSDSATKPLTPAG